MLILIVAGGPDKGRLFELVEGQDVILGREGDQVQLNDRKCSRRHARLWCDDGKWFIEDLGSRHGTHRNHHKITDTQAVQDGDYLQVGQTVLVLARMSQSMVEREALLGTPAVSTPAVSPRTMKLLVGGGAIAAAVLLGVNVMTYLKTTEGTEQLRTQFAQAANDPARAAFEDQVRTMLADGQTTTAEMSQMLALLGPEQEQFRKDLAGQLGTVLAAVEDDSDAQLLVDKFDHVLAAMEAQGGETAKLAGRVLTALADQPTAEQLADATARRVAATVHPLSPEIVEKLTQTADRLASSESVGKQVKELRKLVEKMPGKITPSLETMIVKLDSFDTTEDRDALLAAIAAVQQELPPDPTRKLDAVLARLKNAPTRDELSAIGQRVAALPTLADLESVEQRNASQFSAVTALLNDRNESGSKELDGVRQQLATVVAELKDRPDASLIHKQLESLAANRPTTPDPVLAQVLAAVQERNVNDQKVAALLEKIGDQPYNNDAMLREVRTALAELPAPPAAVDTDALLAALTDSLSEKSITDADQLRTLIRAEVVAAIDKLELPAVSETALASSDTPKPLYEPATPDLTRTEQAYKLAFETGKQIALGEGTVDPVTGRVSGGRVLDPAAAKAAGITHWRDWYLMDDFAERMRLARQASRVRGTLGDPSVVTLPNGSGTFASPRREEN